MINNKINIGIIEPSQIVYEGLINLLLKSNQHFQLYRLEDLDEINDSVINHKLNLCIVNPIFVQNKMKEFQGLKKKLQNIFWIALIYSYFNNELLSMFDKIISINDSNDEINLKISQLINKNIADEFTDEHLTEREIDVLKQLVKGLSNKEIADKLNISIHTVISHRKNISQKTGIKSQSGLTIYSINNKIISLDNL